MSILARVTGRLTILDGYAAADRDELLADRVRLGDLKYTFQTAIEGCIDAAHHVVADQGLGSPSSNAAAFRLLADAGVIDGGLATALAGPSAFATCWCTATPRSTISQSMPRRAVRASPWR